jgi:Iap family predicted aminopeptidase
MTVEQKRAAIRTLVRRVVWDGTEAHVILFGAEEDAFDDAKTPWGEDSKRTPNALPLPKEAPKRGISVGFD